MNSDMIGYCVSVDEPRDTGGVDIQDYQIQLDAGNGYNSEIITSLSAVSASRSINSASKIQICRVPTPPGKSWFFS